MKKILLVIVALVSMISTASAWNARQDEAAVILAEKYLTPQAIVLLHSHLGENYADDIAYIYALEKKKQSPYSKSVHKLHLNMDLTPVEGGGDDALKALEEAMAIVRERTNHSRDEVTTALRVIINLMCDIHNFANVSIEGVPHSQSDFAVQYLNGKNEVVRRKWSGFFTGYTSHHIGYSAAYWAEDFEVCWGPDMQQLSEGSLRRWVGQIGAKAAELYETITPDRVMPLRERLEYEPLAYKMAACTGFRLAALLNELVK